MLDTWQAIDTWYTPNAKIHVCMHMYIVVGLFKIRPTCYKFSIMLQLSSKHH